MTVQGFMKSTARNIVALVAGTVVMAFAQGDAKRAAMLQGQATRRTQEAMPPGPNPNSQYRLGPDSMPQEGVPKGEIRGPYQLPSRSILALNIPIGYMYRRSTIPRFQRR